jgi:hypothetical protein
MTCLEDVDAVIHVKVALSLDRNLQFVIDMVHQDVRSLFVWQGDCKVINLAHKKDAVPVDNSRIQARFVDGRDEANLAKDFVGVLFPEMRGFGVALHGR